MESPSRQKFSSFSKYRNTFKIDKAATLGVLKWVAYPGRSDDNSSTATPYVKCSASIEDSNSSYEYTGDSSQRGYNGEGLNLKDNDSVKVKKGDTITYTIKFFTPDHTTNGSSCASLDSVSVVLFRPRYVSVEIVSK